MKKAILLVITVILIGFIVFRYNVISVKRSLRAFILSGQKMDSMPPESGRGFTTRGAVFFALNELLLDGDSRVREASLTWLLPYQHKFTAPKLIKLLKDPVSSIRLSAAVALGDMKYKGSVLPLAECLQTESDWNVGSEIAIALGRIGDKKASPYLAEKFTKTDNSTLSISLASALFVLTDSNIYSEALEKVLLDGSAEERMRMASVFAMIDSEKLYNLVSSFAGSSEESVRNRAKELLGWTERIKSKFSLEANQK